MFKILLSHHKKIFYGTVIVMVLVVLVTNGLCFRAMMNLWLSETKPPAATSDPQVASVKEALELVSTQVLPGN